jgi:hypothetical protein
MVPSAAPAVCRLLLSIEVAPAPRGEGRSLSNLKYGLRRRRDGIYELVRADPQPEIIRLQVWALEHRGRTP